MEFDRRVILQELYFFDSRFFLPGIFSFIKKIIVTCMKLDEKNQTSNYKKYIRFLKIFPQYFEESPADFYIDKEIKRLKNFY